LRLTSTRKGAHAEVLDRWATLRRDDPVSPSNALRQLWAASRYKTHGDIPAPPMLILTSDKDELVDTRCSRALSAAWKASFAAHPVAGHDLPLDDREWVIAQVARWLRPIGESNDPSPSSSAVE
jgi:pimeloyl-ACP methyl ester carboxylesterase